MKTIKITMTAIIFSAVALLTTSCKKDDPKEPSTQEKLLGKWKFQSIVVNDFYSGTGHITNYPVTAADYIEYRSDNKAYQFRQGVYDTSSYGIINENKIWIEYAYDISDIKTLNNTSLQLYKKITSPTGYEETTTTLYK